MAKTKNLEEPAIAYTFSDDKSIFRLIDAVRNGLPYTLFNKLLDSIPFSLSEWSQYLHLSDRTIQRIRKEKKTFDPVSSERIVEIIRLYNYGTGVFGNKENFDSWLETINLALGSIVPKSLLDTSFGISLLKDELTRIEHGVLA
jgi:putative toxin-antitoxin system antitoxin component (TIGR02293 family)